MHTPLNILLLLLTSCWLSAQVSKGDILVTPAANSPVSKSFAPTPVSGNVTGYSGETVNGEYTLSFLPQVGYAFTDRLVAGVGFKSLHNLDTYSFAQDVVSPFFRYYAINKSGLQAYGGARVNVHLTGDDIHRFSYVRLEPYVGVAVPVGAGIRFAPELFYGPNGIGRPLGLNLNLEFTLNEQTFGAMNDGRYKAGRLMVGTQLGRLSAGRELDDGNEIRLTPEVFYFPVKRLAIGATAGLRVVNEGSRDTRLSFYGASLRYYPIQGTLADVFVQGGLNFSRDPSRGGVGDEILPDAKTQHTLIDGAIGIVTFLAPNVALETGFGLRRNETLGDSEVMFNSGVRFLLGR